MEYTKVCPSEALNIVRELRIAKEVVEEALRDYEFYVSSSGSVTLSGGEPLYQYMFSKTIFKILKEKNIQLYIR